MTLVMLLAIRYKISYIEILQLHFSINLKSNKIIRRTNVIGIVNLYNSRDSLSCANVIVSSYEYI